MANSGTSANTGIVGPVPGIAGPVVVDWGDLAAQLLAHETPIMEAAAQTGVKFALATVPMGSFLSEFVGPTVTKQYVDQALTSLEDVLKGSSLTVSPSEALASLAAKLFNQAEPALASFLGGTVEPMIQGWVSKLLGTPKAPPVSS
jgi:hypothetical protein